MNPFVIEFISCLPPVYYYGVYNGLGGQYYFTRSADLASRFASAAAAESVRASLPMAEVLQVTEHQTN